MCEPPKTGIAVIDIAIGTSTVSGYINFTHQPGGTTQCGAGPFTGTRSGNNIQFSFTSNDPDPGCAFTDGLVFNVSGTLSGDQITNGSYSVPSVGQGGTFSAMQTTRYTGRFTNTSLGIGGSVYIDIAIKTSSVAGYMNFTNDPGVGPLCGAGSFIGTRSGNSIQFSFLSNDPDSGCTSDDGWTFNASATLSGNDITNGNYSVPDVGESGTFYADGPTSSVSGKVVDSGGTPLSGITVSDGAGHTTSTNSNGNYSLSDLTSGAYTITPSKSGYSFSPGSRSVSVPPDATGQNFTVTNRYSISGRVTDGSGNPMPNVPVSCVGLTWNKTVNTDGNGNYAFGGLSAGFYFLKSPSGSPYTLSPAARVIPRVPPNHSNQDFTTTPIYGTLGGRVTDKNTGKAIANARVSAAGKVGRTNSSGYHK